jgi:2-C-methyl-D-erythritol 4-phosphate cytidylyltransferase/2-C-methyl-D-erythritol 2,4-cyclodiphosphate synthase
VFLVEAANRVRARAGNIRNVDVTIICETPKIAPHRDTMRQRISELLGLELQRVSVKATTTETLGFTGRGEGIAALATATVLLPAWSYGPSIGA